MALRFSDALRNALLQMGSAKHVMSASEIRVFTGSQPANANAAQTGTLLYTLTVGSAARTAEVRSSGTVTLTGGASGSVDTVTVNSIEVMGVSIPFNTSLTQTAADVATQINLNPKNLLYIATSSGAVVTLTAKPGLGTLPNTWVVSGTGTTVTLSFANMSGGVNQVNGLTFGPATSGTMVKSPGETWSGVGVANGTAGWFRLVGDVADAGALDSSAVFIRMDGSIATSGADMNMSNTTVAISATQTVNTFSITEPTN